MNILKRIFLAANYRMTVAQNKVLLWKGRKKIELYHNRYAGKRCFIVGNGPSLSVEDLEKIKGEVSFGTHRIYHIFDKTQWRPNYYCAQDAKLINSDSGKMSEIDIEPKIIAILPFQKYKKIKGATYIKLNAEKFYPQLPKFSSDICDGIYEGYTVTYMSLQVAIYMGFSEIYLLGIDHNYSVEMNPDGSIKMTEGIKEHFSNDDTCTNVPQTYKSSLAYCAARKYADQHNVKIFNATRGGKLEAFERVDFDTLFTV